jgi:GMP synthase PP-ATPase subunit
VIEIDKIIKEISKRLNVDIEIVDAVCKHTFLYTVNTMKDPTETRDILFNQLFKFKLKRRYKEDKTQKYSSK